MRAMLRGRATDAMALVHFVLLGLSVILLGLSFGPDRRWATPVMVVCLLTNALGLRWWVWRKPWVWA